MSSDKRKVKGMDTVDDGDGVGNLTLIRVPPGSYTDVIIRPPVVDKVGVSADTARTFPYPGRFTEESAGFGQGGSEPMRQDTQQPRWPYLSISGQQFSPTQPKAVNSFLTSQATPTPYNFQSQRSPLQLTDIQTDGGQTTQPQENQNGTNDEMLMTGYGQMVLASSSPFDNFLQKTLKGIQLLSQQIGLTSYDAFDAFLNTRHIFIEPSNENTESTFSTLNKFDLLDSFGNRLFYAIDKRNDSNGCCELLSCNDSRIDISIVQSAGNEWMRISGTTSVGVVRGSGSGSGETQEKLGYIFERAGFCSMVSDYTLRDHHKNLCFKIRHEPGGGNPTEFDVIGNDGIKIGRVSKYWGSLPESSLDLSNTYGISFPRDMNTHEKGLMIGALISIYWKNFGNPNREMRIIQGAWCCIIFGFIFLLLLIVGFSFLAALVIQR